MAPLIWNSKDLHVVVVDPLEDVAQLINLQADWEIFVLNLPHEHQYVRVGVSGLMHVRKDTSSSLLKIFSKFLHAGMLLHSSDFFGSRRWCKGCIRARWTPSAVKSGIRVAKTIVTVIVLEETEVIWRSSLEGCRVFGSTVEISDDNSMFSLRMQ